jgi:hypothetical protein
MHQSEFSVGRRSAVRFGWGFWAIIWLWDRGEDNVVSVGVRMNYNSQLIVIDCKQETGQSIRRATLILDQGRPRFSLEYKEGTSNSHKLE